MGIDARADSAFIVRGFSSPVTGRLASRSNLWMAARVPGPITPSASSAWPSFPSARCAAEMRLASADTGADALVEAVVAGACATPVRRNCAIGSKSGCFTTGFAGSGGRAGGAATIEIGAERGAAGGRGAIVSVAELARPHATRSAAPARLRTGLQTGSLIGAQPQAPLAQPAPARCAAASGRGASCFANSGAGCGPSCMKRRLETKLTKIAAHASPTSVRSGR